MVTQHNQSTDIQMPINVGRLHFVGIGGIGMSGIAEILINLGYELSGSDISENANVLRLKNLGAKIYIGHNPNNIKGASALIISTAIKKENPEYVQARKMRVPVVHRSEMLAELMRLKQSIAVGGTHGKTTTTSLVAHALMKGNLEPTVINGGIINSLGTNAHFGKGKWLVAEADESDGTFTRLPASIAVVTNMDAEHLDHYGNFDSIKKAFKLFIQNIPFYGCAILCTDHSEVQKLSLQINDRRIITYGLNPQADVRGDNIRSDINGTTFDVYVNGKLTPDVYIPLHGKHNIQNTLASIAVAIEVGIKDFYALYQDFNGVKRRFTKTGTFNGATVIDDYAHHPVEINAVLQASRSATKGKVYAIKQPHRYTRLETLFEDFSTCFNDADAVFITPVYEAGEKPIQGINHNTLVDAIIQSGHNHARAMDSFNAVKKQLHEIAEEGDIIIFLGAGDITTWANSLPNA